MKITFVGIPILFALAIILSATNAYAPCIEGPGINCNNYPPQELTQINSDKLNYEISEKPVITIVGVPSAVAHLEVDDFSSNIVFSHDINLSSNGTARFILDISSYKPGVYSVIATSIVSKITATFAVGLEPSGNGVNPLQSGLIQTGQANLQIIDLKVLPSKVKVGDKFTVTATLVNNSTVPIFVSDMISKDCQGPFFTVSFDNHVNVAITAKDGITCSYVGHQERLDPGKKYTGTSPGIFFTYIATKSGTANVTVTFPYAVKNQTDSTQPNIEYVISKSLLFVISDNNTGISFPHHGGPQISSMLSPLKQFRSGVKINEIHCLAGLQLVIKSSDNSPACVKPEHVTRLIQNGWTLSNPFNRIADADVLSAKTYNLKQVHYYDSSNLHPKMSLYDYSYDGIDKDGMISIANQTFYQTTLDNDIYKLKGVSVQFHNVTFSFPEGTLTTPGGAFVNLDVKFQDGSEEIYGGTILNPGGSGMAGGIPIPTQYGPHVATNSITILGNHTIPQAGLTIYHDKIKLIVSDDNQAYTKENSALKLYMSADTDVVKLGQQIGITISVNNTLATPIEITSQNNWLYQNVSTGPCSKIGYGVSILDGFYDVNNVTQGKSLNLFNPGILCPYIQETAKTYEFQPQSGNVKESQCKSIEGLQCRTDIYQMGQNYKFSGYWDAGAVQPFRSGVYTIIGADEWGHATIQHFVVTNSTIFAGNLGSMSCPLMHGGAQFTATIKNSTGFAYYYNSDQYGTTFLLHPGMQGMISIQYTVPADASWFENNGNAPFNMTNGAALFYMANVLEGKSTIPYAVSLFDDKTGHHSQICHSGNQGGFEEPCNVDNSGDLPSSELPFASKLLHPGVVTSFEPGSVMLYPNSSPGFTATVYANSDAMAGTYWISLERSLCGPGVLAKLVILP